MRDSRCRGPIRSVGPRDRTLVLAGLVCVALLGIGGLAAPASAAAPGSWAVIGTSWTNGVVLCQFPGGGAGVTVSALALSGSGLSLAPTFVEESTPSGTLVADAGLAGGNWTAQNASTADRYDQVFSAGVPIVPGSGGAPVGFAEVGLSYLLSAYAEDSLAHRSVVHLEWTVTNWSWQANGDHLLLGFSAWAAYPSNETLVGGTASDPPLSSQAIATGATREYLELPATVNVSDVGGNASGVPTESQILLQPSNASVTVALGAAAGEFRSMTYTVTIGIPLPASLVGVPLSDYLVVLGGGSAVAAAVAVGTVRVRRRPSSLEFVEGDDE